MTGRDASEMHGGDARVRGGVARVRGLRVVALVAGVVLVALGAAVTLGASPVGEPADPPARAAHVPLALTEDEGPELAHRVAGHAGVAGPITVTAIDGMDVSLATADGWTRTITVGDGTTVTKGGEEVGLAGLAVGDHVRLRQTRDEDGSFSVTEIRVVLPRVAGTVEEVTQSGFTLTGRDGVTRAVTVTESTTYRVGRSEGTKADVAVGSMVVVAGTPSGSSFTAETVVIAAPRVAGQVTAKDGSTLTLRLPGGTSVTVRTSASTAFHVRGVETATIDDVEVGMVAMATGTRATDGSIEADIVRAGNLGGLLEEGRELGRRLGRGLGFGPGFGPFAPGLGPLGPGEAPEG